MNSNAKGTTPGDLKNDWMTPPDLFEAIGKHFNCKFLIDACANEENSFCHYWVSEDENLITTDSGKLDRILKGQNKVWNNIENAPAPAIFMNPPYNDGQNTINDFILKAVESAALYDTSWVLLIPANRTEQEFWHHLVVQKSVHVAFIRKRVNYLHNDGTPSKGANHASVAVALGEIADKMPREISSLYWGDHLKKVMGKKWD